jgi:signal transduction histidine kinase
MNPNTQQSLASPARTQSWFRLSTYALRAASRAASGLEHSLAAMANELAFGPASFEVCVSGRQKELETEVQEQVLIIAREALLNALRHSDATAIEAEIEYLPAKVRIVVRDNGSGIDQATLSNDPELHWGLLEMRERASNIDAQLCIWSRPGAGTEVEISAPYAPALAFASN